MRRLRHKFVNILMKMTISTDLKWTDVRRFERTEFISLSLTHTHTHTHTPYILESNPHLVFATFLNQKKKFTRF
jgi:hypothetical protein